MNILPSCVDKKMPYKMIDGLVWHKVPYTDKYVINPTDIACQALRGNKDALEWLVYSLQASGAYRHNYDIPYYGVNAPWTGALTQALAVMALLKHGERARAHRACKYMVDVCSKNGVFYEKPGVFILNGHMYCTLALQAMVKAGYQSYERALLQAETIVRCNLPTYTMKNGWTIYDETGIPATQFYHDQHFYLANEIQKITRDITYFEYMLRWLAAEEPKLIRLLYIAKKHGIKTFAMYLKRRRWLHVTKKSSINTLLTYIKRWLRDGN